MAHIDKLLAEIFREKNQATIAQKVADTFGENPCQGLILENFYTGDEFLSLCDSKGCGDCGPRKLMLMWLQLQANMGELAHIGRCTERTAMDQAISSTVRHARRHGDEFTYQIVGNHTAGWIVVANQQLRSGGLRLMELAEWKDRISEWYRLGRVRRSHKLGRLSLLPIRRTSETGTPSHWQRVRRDSQSWWEERQRWISWTWKAIERKRFREHEAEAMVWS